MSTRTREMARDEVKLRAQHARDYLEAAIETQALHPNRTNVIASNAVLAGIAAADAICGRVLKRRSVGEDHKAASALLGTATIHGAEYARDLNRLLDIKTSSQYSALTIAEATSEKALFWAGRLVTAMEQVLQAP